MASAFRCLRAPWFLVVSLGLLWVLVFLRFFGFGGQWLAALAFGGAALLVLLFFSGRRGGFLETLRAARFVHRNLSLCVFYPAVAFLGISTFLVVGAVALYESESVTIIVTNVTKIDEQGYLLEVVIWPHGEFNNTRVRVVFQDPELARGLPFAFSVGYLPVYLAAGVVYTSVAVFAVLYNLRRGRLLEVVKAGEAYEEAQRLLA